MNDMPTPHVMQIFPNGINNNENVPARIKIAMDYLNLLSYKESTKPNSNGVSVGEINGTELTQEEKDTRKDALELLTDYFGGRLKTTIWDDKFGEFENEVVEGINCGCDVCTGKVPQPQVPKSYPSPIPESKVVDCPICITKGLSPACPICKGSSKVLVTPYKMP